MGDVGGVPDAIDHASARSSTPARHRDLEEHDVSQAHPSPTTSHRLTRGTDGKLIAGVATGVGDHFGIEPNLVRLAFVVLALAGGAGVVLYVAGWIWMPSDDGTGRSTRALHAHDAARRHGRSDWVQIVALGAVTLGVFLLAQSIGLGLSDAFVWPVVLAALGAVLIVGRSGKPIDELISELVGRERGGVWRDGERDTTAIARVVIGGMLVVAGVGAFLFSQKAFTAIGQGLLAVAVLLGGLALIFGPWLWRLWNALVEERSERIRSDERAEMAAHLHDSVLQTLAMIQRKADDPRAVVGIARRQERELRSWLFGRAPVHADLDLGDAIEDAAADVEQRHGVRIETVHVGGECPLDDRGRVLVLAAREAMLNAARHSGAPLVAVYLEVEPEQLTMFVRDRGRGFSVDDVANDRGGIAESILGRMQRNGGTATIRSFPGQGTEIELTMKRARV
ncbi:MAG TPA: PspC domain-containing protein [Acidimicrobiia bacterium]|nr:PspC domain-containing protein [Acidimicrobiia bacterium]